MATRASIGGEGAVALPAAILRGLNDKVYDKRKAAALEVERIVREHDLAGESAQVHSIIALLCKDFTFSANPNTRKGGLIGLAATAIALGTRNVANYIAAVVPPVLACFLDQDARVRYYACEALYNIAKIARQALLPCFNEVFDGLCKLSADPDPNVKNAADLLDRLLKDIVSESPSFELAKFIPVLRDRIYAVHPNVRQFLVGWISAFNHIPEIEPLEHLPSFLGGLFSFLGDPARDIRVLTEALLAEFREQMALYPQRVNFELIAPILIQTCASEDELTLYTSLTWIRDLVELAGVRMVPFTAELLAAVLPRLSHDLEQVREVARLANQALERLIAQSEGAESARISPDGGGDGDAQQGSEEANAPFDIAPTVQALLQQLGNASVETRIAALRWLLMLHVHARRKALLLADVVFPALLKNLGDASDMVVVLNLEVLSEISTVPAPRGSNGESDARTRPEVEVVAPNGGAEGPAARRLQSVYFRKFMERLLALLGSDRELLDRRGPFIIRQLCMLLGPECIYRSMADILDQEADLAFASLVVQHLHLILLTSPELFSLRTKLKDIEEDNAAHDLFMALYPSWCHNPIATLSLCLLAGRYRQADRLTRRVAELDVTVALLVEIDRLVQLLESPIFTRLRLRLLEPWNYPELVRTMYGLLMLLPQSTAFETLRTRLQCIPTVLLSETIRDHLKRTQSNASTMNPSPTAEVQRFRDEDGMVRHFDAVQARHTEERKSAIRRASSPPL